MAKTLIGNFRGPKGDNGIKGDTGASGTQGVRGSQQFDGTGVTGTSTTAKTFSGSGVTSALVGDHYLNTSTGDLYRCDVAGAATVAKWTYIGNMKGPKGDTGDVEANADASNNTVTYTAATTLTDLVKGEKLSVAFAKLAKAVTDLIAHLKDTQKHITNGIARNATFIDCQASTPDLSSNDDAIATTNFVHDYIRDNVQSGSEIIPGTNTTIKGQFAADSWELNKSNSGSYAAGVETKFQDLTTNLGITIKTNFPTTKGITTRIADYPQGFSFDNCFLLAYRFKFSIGTDWYVYLPYFNTVQINFQFAPGGIFCYLQGTEFDALAGHALELRVVKG